MDQELTHIPTDKFARTLGCKPSTLRRSLCVKGHYLGIKPRKMANGRLMWPIEEARKLLSDGEPK